MGWLAVGLFFADTLESLEERDWGCWLVVQVFGPLGMVCQATKKGHLSAPV